MTAVSGSTLSYSAKGNREDLSDIIYNISPEDTPFMSNAGKGKASAVLHEWQTDALAAAAANAQLEGDAITAFDAFTATVRIGNYAQISRKLVSVSETQEVVSKAGRKSELAYQRAKVSAELKRDLEFNCLQNTSTNAGSSTVARVTGSFLVFLKSNINKASDGTSPVYTTIPNATRTDGTLRTVTETFLKDVVKQAYDNGGMPTLVMVGSGVKQTFSGFAGIATKTLFHQDTVLKPGSILGAADVYVSDFGKLSIIPNRFQRSRDAFVWDPEYVRMFYLRPFKIKQLAISGDVVGNEMLVVEWGVQVDNEKSHALIADIQA